MEGRGYKCAWQGTAAGYRLWVKDQPTLAVTCTDLTDGWVDLQALIGEKTGDYESELDFVPPLPVKRQFAAVWRPDYVALCGKETLYNAPWNTPAYLQPQERLYSQGYCCACQRPCGERTEKSAAFNEVPARADSYLSRSMLAGTVYSAALLARLPPAFIAGLRLIPVKYPGKPQLLELAGGREVRPFVGVRQLEQLLRTMREPVRNRQAGCRCHCLTCGQLSAPLYLIHGIQQARFIFLPDAAHIESLPEALVAGQPGDYMLCVRRDVWATLSKKPGARKTSPASVGCVVHAADVVAGEALSKLAARVGGER